MANFLGYSKKNPVPLTPHRDSQIKYVFPSDELDKLGKGSIVTLKSDGKVALCAADDLPLGRVEIAENPYKEGGCTVTLMHGAGMAGEALVDVQPGDMLSANGAADETGITKFQKTGTYITALALTGGAAGEVIDVLVFNSPFKR